MFEFGNSTLTGPHLAKEFEPLFSSWEEKNMLFATVTISFWLIIGHVHLNFSLLK